LSTTLPNYFLADLPPEATLSAGMITEACQTLKRNRAHYLEPRSTQNLIATLSNIAKEWLNPEYHFRRVALEQGPAVLSFSRATLENGLNTLFKRWTPAAFEALLSQDLGHPQRLDKLCATEAERNNGRAALANGPHLLAHITAGNLPNPSLVSLALGLLTRSAQFLKCASGTALLPRLFAHSIYEANPKLGACIEIAEWKGGNTALETALFAEADCVTATGSDEALEDIRRRLPPEARFLGYGHRVSFAYIACEALTGLNIRKVAQRAAADVAAWNQLGCLSPHIIYVQEGGLVGAEKFAELLSEELASREETEPRGELAVDAAAAIASRRSLYEVRAAHSPETRHWFSKNSTAWSVVYESDPRFQLSCLNRFIYVKSVANLAEALQSADSVRGKISTIGVAAPDQKMEELATELARWGASRICPLGQMQDPPLTWRHDGRPALAALVRWTDWEQEQH
jgi:Acyl-CoA reductase (LuxC)